MYLVKIDIKDGQKGFVVGDTVSGEAQITLSLTIALPNLQLSFNCLGQVKWVECHGTTRKLTNRACYDQLYYHEDVFLVAEKDITVIGDITNKRLTIPFKFIIPKLENLPSTMVSNYGFVKYFVRVTIKQQNSEEIAKKFIKEVVVQSPIAKDLMITVGGRAEKCVCLHCGKVSMHASIGRKGFAPGDTITVHVTVNNQTNDKVIPRLSLSQVQIFMSDHRHNTVESTLNENKITASAIESHTEMEELLNVIIPVDQCLTIKSSLITVTYFVCVTLDIPHSFELYVNLPVVVTSKKMLNNLQHKRKKPERV